MKSTAHIKGHPIHPMLIPYPFALLSGAVAFDIGARGKRRAAWSATARHLTVAGLGSALVAAIPGVVDYFGSVPPGTRARRDATTHALFNLSALACFAVAHLNRRPDGRMPAGGLTLALLGTGLLSRAGWLGGELVYHHHVAVVEQSDATLPQERPSSTLRETL